MRLCLRSGHIFFYYLSHTHMNESCHTYEWVMSHTWIFHVTHMNPSCPTRKSRRLRASDQVVWKESYTTCKYMCSHVFLTHVNNSCHTFQKFWNPKIAHISTIDFEELSSLYHSFSYFCPPTDQTCYFQSCVLCFQKMYALNVFWFLFFQYTTKKSWDVLLWEICMWFQQFTCCNFVYIFGVSTRDCLEKDIGTFYYQSHVRNFPKALVLIFEWLTIFFPSQYMTFFKNVGTCYYQSCVYESRNAHLCIFILLVSCSIWPSSEIRGRATIRAVRVISETRIVVFSFFYFFSVYHFFQKRGDVLLSEHRQGIGQHSAAPQKSETCLGWAEMLGSFEDIYGALWAGI